MLDIAAKDFIETPEGLVFAVVMPTLEQGKVLCFLRYVTENHLWKKLSTEQANTFLKQHYPQYLYYSPVLDAHLHAVALERIAVHHQPKQRLQQLLQSKYNDLIEADAVQLCDFLQANAVNMAQLGITGSLLIRAQHRESDIDLVCYQKQTFQHCRKVIKLLIEQGRIQHLTEADWQEAYSRRDCALNFADYVWHEQRKYNKAMINGRKFDLSLVSDHAPSNTGSYQKCGAITLQCKITDDSGAFDYPAEFSVDAEGIATIVSFTATYTGQAQCGETVEVSGTLEQDQHGIKRVVVGSSREAHGEYIKVIHA
ncbi:conserved hypothetical protein [Crenothrix polyspora]|uniref:Polymerase nucleotidyl transferase domain-containing protein n=1 Tax=Crenothrix polyspora TaxID=360316 RepID=A0A1R4HGR7_9GAMM|nr:hypothetical protein [Crenothrix polyspora]SJM95414.1 conserved hypothetical protein [Crenothrix polyspora]